MSSKQLKECIIVESGSIKDAMRLIDHSGLRVAYVVDKSKKMLGVVSDSEIRKAILKGKDINKPVRETINSDPIVISYDEIDNPLLFNKKVKKLLQRMPDSRHILALDKQRRPLKLLPIAASKSLAIKENILGEGKTILVVGGAGYLGSILVRKLLDLKFKVRVLDALLYGRQPIEPLFKQKNFELVEGDMRNISTLIRSLDGIDAVVNLAAIVGDPACNNKPEMAIETNFLANKALAEACKYNQVNRFVYASTCSVYGTMDGDQKLTESSPLNPVSLYARSKIHAEEGILSLEDDNFSPTILRMSTLYGYSFRMRFDLVVNTMTKTAVAEKKIFVHGGGQQWRPLLNVADAAEAYIKALRAPLARVKGEIYNVGSEAQNFRIIDIARAMKEVVPEAELVVQGEATDLRNYFVSFDKVNNELGFKPAAELKDSMRRIKKALEEKEYPDVNDPKYYNVEVVKP